MKYKELSDIEYLLNNKHYIDYIVKELNYLDINISNIYYNDNGKQCIRLYSYSSYCYDLVLTFSNLKILKTTIINYDEIQTNNYYRRNCSHIVDKTKIIERKFEYKTYNVDNDGITQLLTDDKEFINGLIYAGYITYKKYKKYLKSKM